MNIKYTLWLTTEEDEGYSSRMYGWSEGVTMTYEQALKEKKKLEILDKYCDIEIVRI